MSEHQSNTSLVLGFLLLVAALLLPAQAFAGDLLFEQRWDNLTRYDSTITPFSNKEVADDFDLVASIERIVVGGTSVTLDNGVWVRFYDGSTDRPGVLQAEHFFAEGDPNLVIGNFEWYRFDITLPVPFEATGHHYVSVQAEAPGAWFWWNGDLSTVGGTLAYQRTDGGEWSTVLDVCFSLYGTLRGPGQIDSLGETSLPRSGFLEIFGSGLGSTGQVLVGGEEAIVNSWTDDRIAAYVPEGAGPGVAPVQVVHEGGASNTLDLEVTLRQQNGPELWHVRLDTYYSQVRPAVGPDGTIYVVDVNDRLYAVSADGAVLWVTEQAGSKGVAVDSNGFIYTGNENWVKSFNPDGTERWRFDQTPRAFVFPAIAVGPDGNVYALGTSGMGIFSLTPGGQLRWATPEPYDRPIVSYTEIAFGPGPNGDPQLYFSANRHMRAIRLEDGQQVFLISPIGTPAVSPVDGTVHGSYFAYLPDGSLAWQFEEFLNGTPTIGASGVHYSTTSMVTPRIYAINTSGSQRWMATLPEPSPLVDVDPTEARIVLGSQGLLFNLDPGAVLLADTADGRVLWRFELPVQDPHIPNPWTGEMGFQQFPDSRSAFASDGSAAYMMTAIAPGDATTPRAFLYAFDLGEPATEGLLRSVDIRLAIGPGVQTAMVRGWVTIHDEAGVPVPDAEVRGAWTVPDGRTMRPRPAMTDAQGRVMFVGKVWLIGTYTFTLEGVVKDGYTFDPDNSVMSASIDWAPPAASAGARPPG